MLCYLPRRNLADRSVVCRLLIEYNPFYLLSALFMLAGLFALNNSLDWSPLPVGNVLILIATLNLYELLLIGLAVFLHHRGISRDAFMLLVIEAFFLADAGFLNAEIFTQAFHVGLVVNTLLLALGVVKVAVIFRALSLPLRSGPFLLIALQLAVLCMMPGLLKYVSLSRHGAVPAVALYGIWWVVGALVALYGLLLRRIDFTGMPQIERFGRYRGIVLALLMLGLVSILAHLCTSNWVYNLRWYSANLTPLLLGLAVALGLLEGVGLKYRRRMHALSALPMIAIMISVSFPSALVIGPMHLSPLTPLRLALLSAAAVYLLGLWKFRLPGFAILSAGCLFASALGSSVATMVENVVIFNRTMLSYFRSVTPRRTVHWGFVSVIIAFALLALGFVLSMKKEKLSA